MPNTPDGLDALELEDILSQFQERLIRRQITWADVERLSQELHSRVEQNN